MQLVGHQERVRRLVELRAERVGRGLAVDEAVARHRAVGLLLALEQEERRVARGGEVAVGHQAGPGLVQVAREHLAVRAEVRVAPGRRPRSPGPTARPVLATIAPGNVLSSEAFSTLALT